MSVGDVCLFGTVSVTSRQAGQVFDPIEPERAAQRIPTGDGSNDLTSRNLDVDRIVEQLMHGDLTKEQRLAFLRELARSDDDMPDEVVEAALRKLMERVDD